MNSPADISRILLCDSELVESSSVFDSLLEESRGCIHACGVAEEVAQENGTMKVNGLKASLEM
jgi:hypothetical protein